MGFGLPNQEETHRREFESPPGYHTCRSNMPSPYFSSRRNRGAPVIPEPIEQRTPEIDENPPRMYLKTVYTEGRRKRTLLGWAAAGLRERYNRNAQVSERQLLSVDVTHLHAFTVSQQSVTKKSPEPEN